MFETYVWKCIRTNCKNTEVGKEGDHCFECGKPLFKVDSKESKGIDIKKAKFKTDPDYLRKEGTRIQAEAETNKKIRKIAEKHKFLFHNAMSDDEILGNIYQDMSNLSGHEAGTSWMRLGTLLSFNATQQMVGAGFKAIIDQNKVIIRQNELLLREMKRINEKLPVDLNSNKKDLDE